MMIALAFLRIAWPYLLAALVVGSLWYAEEHRCNAACKAQMKRADASEAREATAKRMAAAIAVKYGEQVQATAAAEVKLEGERNARFVPVESAAHNLPAAVARIRVPASAVRVLDDAVDAANASLAKPAAGAVESARAPAADSDLEGLTAWGVTCAKQYAEAADEVIGWQRFYAGLQAAQLAEQLH